MSWRKWIGTTLGTAKILYIAPGTSTSIIVWLGLMFLGEQLNLFFTLLLLLICIILGVWSIDGFEAEDPKEFTLDECFAVILIYLFFHQSYTIALLSLLLFRFFDITKILGIKALEKASKKNRLFSIYIDDIVAAIYTIIICRIILYANIL